MFKALSIDVVKKLTSKNDIGIHERTKDQANDIQKKSFGF
jgi:hypothetical protein